MDILNTAISAVTIWILEAYNFLISFYELLVGYWPYQNELELKYALLIFIAVIVIAIVVIAVVVGNTKKRKIQYFIDGVLHSTEKVKYGEKLNFPVVEKEGMVFDGWYTGKKRDKKYLREKLNKKGNVKFYAKYKAIGEDRVVTIKDYAEPSVVEKTIEQKPVNSFLGKLYDDIRYEMLGYERASAFKNIGVVRKQIVAEMFERDGVIHLYLALDPELMREKGYKVTTYKEPEFAIVPCKKEVCCEDDYIEAIKLIKEAMVLNNFIKCEHRRIQRTQSDEKTRKNGFAFFVKNEVIATSASDYYKLLRAVVLSYSLASGNQFPKDLDNKMILKIFKKDEQIFLYLALDADREGLEFVGYDKNFADTPAKFEIKVSESLIRANQLVDKLMYRFGMEKHPESAELLIDEEIKTNCGFGYRIRH